MSSFLNITILLESALKQLNSDTITEFFSNVLIGIFILAILFFIFVYPKKHSRLFSFATNFVDYSPVLLTSVGILGTFTGIVAGLLNFDITNIDSSISALLGGMKTAFLSSVIGVGFSILLKIFYNFKYSKKKNTQPVDIPSVIEKFYEQAELTKGQTEYTKEQTEHIKALSESIHTLTKAIGGDADNSLLSQLKLLRSDIADNNKATQQILEPISQNITHLKELSEESKLEFVTFETQLWTKLDNFAEMMSKSATEQVIEALKQVITEFNQHLVEQFGENFKQLNQAVLALITWQDNYKTQLTEMIKLYETGVKTLSDTERSVTSIEHSTQEIPKTMANLSQVISTNQAQINDLENHLLAFAELKEKATSAIPEVKSQIDLMLQGVTEGNKLLINGLNDSSKELISGLNQSSKELISGVNQSSKELVHSMDQSSKELINGLSQGGKELHRNLDTIVHELKNTADSVLKKQKDMQSEFGQLNNALHTQFEDLMRTQSNEVRKLMNQLAHEGENALKVTGESVNKQLKLIDDSMQSEINRVMTEMGNALATISNKFTTDYKDLVNKMYTITSYKKGH